MGLRLRKMHTPVRVDQTGLKRHCDPSSVPEAGRLRWGHAGRAGSRHVAGLEGRLPTPHARGHGAHTGLERPSCTVAFWPAACHGRQNRLCSAKSQLLKSGRNGAAAKQVSAVNKDGTPGRMGSAARSRGHTAAPLNRPGGTSRKRRRPACVAAPRERTCEDRDSTGPLGPSLFLLQQVTAVAPRIGAQGGAESLSFTAVLLFLRFLKKKLCKPTGLSSASVPGTGRFTHSHPEHAQCLSAAGVRPALERRGQSNVGFVNTLDRTSLCPTAVWPTLLGPSADLTECEAALMQSPGFCSAAS